MTDIRVEQIDNVWAKVECEPSIAKELSEFFTFEVPGARFSPQYRNKYWDGKIRLFSEKTRRIYAGLMGYVIEFAKLNEYSYTMPVVETGSELAEPVKTPLEIRDYQLVAFRYALLKKRAIIISPTASGKSLIIYQIIRSLLSNGKKRGLLIVPTTSLVEQMYGDFKDYGWSVEKNCQRIYAGWDKAPSAPLVISTWQSIYDMPKKYFAQFDFVIGDEAHTFKADSLKHIMTNLTNCDYRIGMTGTLDGTKVNKLVLEGLFGPVKKIISTKELIDRGQLAKFEVKCLVLKHPEQECKKLSGADYNAEIEHIISHPKRNNFIGNLAKGLDGNTLILYTYVDKHGKPLYELIKEKVTDRKVHFICGQTDVLDREEVRRITEQETNSIIIASYGTFAQGINIRNLHNVVFASPTKSQIRTLQSIGRGLRLGDNKTKAVLYDVADDLRHKTYVNFTLKHYEERVKIYNNERFPIKIHNIGI